MSNMPLAHSHDYPVQVLDYFDKLENEIRQLEGDDEMGDDGTVEEESE